MVDIIPHLKKMLLKSSGVILFLVLWEAVPRLGWIDPKFAPPFSVVLVAIYQLWADGTLVNHLTVSLWRIIMGILVAAAIGLPIGCVLGTWMTRTAEKLDPLLRIFGQVNPFALMPVFILFFGIGEEAKIAIIAWVCVWPILFYTVTGIRNVDPLLTKSAQSMGASAFAQLTRVILPGAAPTIFTGLRVSLGLALFMLVAAEMIGASSGLGWLVHNSSQNFQVPRLYASATLIVLLGVFINKSFLALEKGLFVWKDTLPGLVEPESKAATRRLGKGHLILVGFMLLVVLVAGGMQVERFNNNELGYHNQPMNHQMPMGQ